MQCWLAVGQYPVGKRAAYGQHAVCAWTARGQHTACAWSAHGQHAVTLWPACDRSRAHSFTNIILLVIVWQVLINEKPEGVAPFEVSVKPLP